MRKHEHFSRRIKKQFFKHVNSQIRQKALKVNNGKAFTEWNDQVSSLWLTKISETHKLLEQMKKIKVSHKN
jgi:hypothetical protein